MKREAQPLPRIGPWSEKLDQLLSADEGKASRERLTLIRLFTDQPDLVLDLSLLPARRRGAGDRIDEVMAAHLQEPSIVETLFADEDGRHCRLHVVVDAALAGAQDDLVAPVELVGSCYRR